MSSVKRIADYGDSNLYMGGAIFSTIAERKYILHVASTLNAVEHIQICILQ